MTLQNDITEGMRQGNADGTFALTIVLREYKEDNETYYVAECLEIPGCVSEGDTEAEARANIDDAVKLCLSVMFEDCVRQAMERRLYPDLTNIKSQRRLTVSSFMPELSCV